MRIEHEGRMEARPPDVVEAFQRFAESCERARRGLEDFSHVFGGPVHDAVLTVLTVKEARDRLLAADPEPEPVPPLRRALAIGGL